MESKPANFIIVTGGTIKLTHSSQNRDLNRFNDTNYVMISMRVIHRSMN